MKQYRLTIEKDDTYLVYADNERLAVEQCIKNYFSDNGEAPKIKSISVFQTFTNEEYKKHKEAVNISHLEQLTDDGNSTVWTKDKEGNYYCNGKKQKTTAIVTTVKNKLGEDVTNVEWE